MAEKDAQTVTIKRVRLSFNELVEAEASVKDGPKKFGAHFIIDPETPQGAANVKACKVAIDAAEMDLFGKPGVIKATVDDRKRLAFRRGETFKDKEGAVYSGYENMVGVVAKNKKRPKLYDRRKEAVAVEDIEEVFQSGQFCDAIVRFYCVSDTDKGGNGLFAEVAAIRAHQEGEIFGGGVKVDADDFDDLEDIVDEPTSGGNVDDLL